MRLTPAKGGQISPASGGQPDRFLQNWFYAASKISLTVLVQNSPGTYFLGNQGRNELVF